MRVAIVPWSPIAQSESLPTYRYFKAKGADITAIYWGEPEIPADVHRIKIEKGQEIPGLDDFDLIVRGPAVHPTTLKTTKPVTSLMDIFVGDSASKNIIAVTGTKGKGTTSTLVAKILEAQGKKVWLGGNIGKPLLDDLDKIQPDDWIVLEMSAGQLITFHQTIHIGVCLMVVPDHMDWHKDMDEYTDAKSQLFKSQKPDDVAVYFAQNEYSKQVAGASPGKKMPYFAAPGARVREDGMIVIGEDEQEIISKTEVKLLGEHNLQNICAACTAVFEATGSLDKAKAVLSSFSGLEHRLELVREFEGVKYYDDSFATTPETVIVAMKAVSEPKVLILGGFDKGAHYEELADEVLKSNVHHVVTIGTVGPRIAKQLRAKGFSSITEDPKNMNEIVQAAKANSHSGDAVLLSTGTSSFDMFKDYKDRGNQFKKAVAELS